MTSEEYREKIEALAQEAAMKVVANSVVPALNLLQGTIVNRITRTGIGSDGQRLGNYSQKEGWYTREQFSRRATFQPRSKIPGKKTKKTMYFPDGYKGLRDHQGYPTDTINLFYRGDLMRSFGVVDNDGIPALAVQGEKNIQKKRGNENRFGRFFYANEKEFDMYAQAAAKEIQLVITKLLAE